MLADEVREELIYVVSEKGGHLSASLGVAELTVALHHVFNTLDDKIIWDVAGDLGILIGFYLQLPPFSIFNLYLKICTQKIHLNHSPIPYSNLKI